MANWFEQFIARRNRGLKGLSISQSGTSMQPGGFVTEIRSLNGLGIQSTSTGALQAAQMKNELVFACINIKATAALDPRLVVQKRVNRNGKVEWEEQIDHPFRALLMRPNPDMTEADLMKAAFVSWDVSNPRRFFCAKEYTNGLLTALYPLNPGCMEPIIRNNTITGYCWSDGSQRRDYGLDELLIRSAPSWYDPPPLVAALGAVDSDSSQTDYVRAFFANGGVPPGLLNFNRPLNETQRDEIRDKWRSVYGNRTGRQHGIGVLDVDVKWQETGATLDKLQSQTLRSVAEARICMTFGVPPLIVYAYVGLLRATYSNLKEAWAGFWDATMSPAFREWRLFWLWGLLTEYEDERAIRSEAIRLQYDFSQVAAMQEDVDAIQKRARENYAAGVISFNEFRAAIGSMPVPGGDDLYVAKPMTNLSGMLTPVSVPMPAPPKRLRKDKNDAELQRVERTMQRQSQGYLAEQYRTAANGIRDLATVTVATVDQLGLDFGDGIGLLLRRSYEVIAQNAFASAATTLAVDIAFDLANDKVQQVLDQLAKQVKVVSETTRDEIRALIGKQASEGWSISELADAIIATGATNAPSRAEMIARTETANAYTRASILAYQESGVVDQVQWLTAGDDLVSDLCASLSGKAVNAGDEFAPGIVGPPSHPNCRCDLIPIVRSAP